jgi:nucleoid-associated protein YgaU
VTKDRLAQAAPWFLGALAAFIAGILVIAALPSDQPAPEQAAIAETQPEPQSTQAPVPVVETAPQPLPEPEPEVAAPLAPDFDTFRLEPDGMMVIAGRAAPNQVVAIMLGDVAIERTTADASGSFATIAMASPSEQPRRVMLLGDPDGARVPSQTSFLVAPIAAPVVVAEIAEPVIAQEAAPDPAVAPEPAVPTPAAEVADPVVIAADTDGLRVVQGGANIGPAEVTLDAITYAPDGAVQVSGRATSAAAVQLYLDNQAIAMALVDADAAWQLDLRDVAAGVYTLRVDALDLTGAVVSRLETPFQRERAADVAAVLAEAAPAATSGPVSRVVQPGSTLWAIAEETLGNGIFYVAVFDANRDLIRDPDLIYPGQVFVIPQAAN